MDNIFIRYSAITDSLIKAGYKQVMQVLVDNYLNSNVHTFWANGSRLIRVCSKDMFSIKEIERVNTEESIMTFCTSNNNFMDKFYKVIIGPDSENLPSVLEIFDDILYCPRDKQVDKKLKLDKALSNYPEFRKALGDTYSDITPTPAVKLNPYDFYTNSNTATVGYVVATDNDGFLFQEIGRESRLRYYASSELDNMTPSPDMHDNMQMLLHNTMCAFRDFLEYSRVVDRLEFVGYTNIGSMLDMNNSYEFSDCSVGFKDNAFDNLCFVRSSNLLATIDIDILYGYLVITNESKTFTEESSEVIVKSVKPCDYLDTVKVVATQILIKFASALVDNDETVKYLDDLVCTLSELDKIGVDPDLQWGDMRKPTTIKQNLQKILSRVVSFGD